MDIENVVTYTTEYYSATKTKKSLPFATTRMDLEGFMLSEVSEREKDILYVLLICRI